MDTHQSTVEQVMAPHMWAFYAAFLGAFILTPMMQVVARSLGILDRPDGRRKLHRRPIPYLGGLAIFLGCALGLLVSMALRSFPVRNASGYLPLGVGIISGAIVMVSLGLWDDVRGVRPRWKVAGQLISAGCLLASGIGLHSTQPGLYWAVNYLSAVTNGGIHSIVQFSEPHWFKAMVFITGVIFTVLVVVGACNATNLMDGLDGLCGGVTAIIFAGFLFVCVHLATTSPGQGLGGDGARMAMALALLGAVLGFVPFNFNPASIFMGDTGSMFLGFSCGTLMLLLAEVQSKWFLASMVIFALPILDTALAFARRWIAGRPLFSADSKHFHHQLMQRGLSTRQTVAIAYALTLVFTALGLVITFTRTRFAIAIYLVIFACLGVAAHKMGMIHERKRRSLNSNKATRAQTLSSEDFAKIIAQAPDPEFGELLRIAWETGCRSRQARTVSANDVDLTNRAWVLSSPDLNDPHRVKIITLNDVALEITQRRMREFPIGPLFRDPRGLPWTPASCSARFRAMGRILQRRYTFKAIQIGRKMATAGAGNPRSTSAPVWIEAGVSGGSLKEDVDDSGFGVRGIGALDASA